MTTISRTLVRVRAGTVQDLQVDHTASGWAAVAHSGSANWPLVLPAFSADMAVE